MLNWRNARLRFGPPETGPAELLTDLKALSEAGFEQHMPWRTYQRGDNIERARDSYLAEWAPAPCVFTFHPHTDIDVLCSPTKPKFYSLHFQGLSYVGDWGSTGLRMNKNPVTGAWETYWALVFSRSRFAPVGDPRPAFAEIMWGTRNVVPVEPQSPLGHHIRSGGCHWDKEYFESPAPWQNPPKDMSSFDSQLEALYGRAASAHLLKSILAEDPYVADQV